MTKKIFDTVNFDTFKNKYMSIEANMYSFNNDTIQIYPLEIASSIINTPTPLFRANYNFLLIFLGGGGIQQVDNDIITLNTNDVLFIREGHLNAIKEISPDTKGYYIYIDSLLLPQIFNEEESISRYTYAPKQSITKNNLQWIALCCDLIMRQKKEGDKSDEILISLLRALFQKLNNALPSNIKNIDRQSTITLRFKELLYLNYKKHREIGFYADSLAVSENYLTRCIKKSTQKSPKQHINETLIYQSKVLLQDYNKSISEIAYELGFSDPSYFGRLFKQVAKQKPTDYRKSLLHEKSDN